MGNQHPPTHSDGSRLSRPFIRCPVRSKRSSARYRHDRAAALAQR